MNDGWKLLLVILGLLIFSVLIGIKGITEGFIITTLVIIGIMILFLCVFLAPLFIWRNTNKTNELLAKLIVKMMEKDNIHNLNEKDIIE